jgi:hypothetical protein
LKQIALRRIQMAEADRAPRDGNKSAETRFPPRSPIFVPLP